MQKQEIFLSEGHRSQKDVIFWVQNIKVPFGIGHPHTYTSNLVYMCVGGFRSPKSSNGIELCWFVQELLQFFQFRFPQLGGGGVGQGWGYLEWPTIVYMSSEVFRGKESLNRIEWVDWWVNWWAHVKSLKSNKSWPTRNWLCGVVVKTPTGNQ